MQRTRDPPQGHTFKCRSSTYTITIVILKGRRQVFQSLGGPKLGVRGTNLIQGQAPVQGPPEAKATYMPLNVLSVLGLLVLSPLSHRRN